MFHTDTTGNVRFAFPEFIDAGEKAMVLVPVAKTPTGNSIRRIIIGIYTRFVVMLLAPVCPSRWMSCTRQWYRYKQSAPIGA
jgi:hypothetical protein